MPVENMAIVFAAQDMQKITVAARALSGKKSHIVVFSRSGKPTH